ncbi:MAG: twin-arginine translocation signal domain-containing protein, partial [Selenomonadaceae bacterium]|nr:twin-arginine translocation signal domain-containing protein [Selenomonadaceae bacterium]
MNKGDISRRDFFKMAGIVAAGAAFSNFGSMGEALAQAPVIGSEDVTKTRSRAGSRAKVYFTKHIDADHLIKLYNRVSENIYGKVAIKLHTGEQHGPNILPCDMVKAFQAYIPNSNIVETNTMYPGDRDTTEKHRETLKVNGWTFCPVDIMDEDGGVMLPV